MCYDPICHPIIVIIILVNLKSYHFKNWRFTSYLLHMDQIRSFNEKYFYAYFS